MSVNRYGILMAWRPGIDLCAEGLGRYLANFIKGAEEIPDVQLVIVCPSWSKKALKQLFESERVSPDKVLIISPAQKPLLLKVLEMIKQTAGRSKSKGAISSIFEKSSTNIYKACLSFIAGIPASITSIIIVCFGLPLVLLLLMFALPIILGIKMVSLISRWFLRSAAVMKLRSWLATLFDVRALVRRMPGILDLYKVMENHEFKKMEYEIKKCNDVIGWYCPTAFWPYFSEMDVPVLTCVPDVHFADFPVGFAKSSPFTAGFYKEGIERTIHSGKYFVTYSETQKWNNLVDRFFIDSENIFVVKHAPNDLCNIIDLQMGKNTEEAITEYCKQHLLRALSKAYNYSYGYQFSNDKVKFLFYASQFRPNKNVITLLRAYEYLLREKFLQHKLILTGYPDHDQDIKNFVINRGLENDVLFLNNLDLTELAACYKLADLAICPSFAEGGGPFTFSEALSVNTPSLIACSGVSEELISDIEIRDLTLFDPYSFRDLADKIEHTLQNKSYILLKQKEYFEVLNKRTWKDVTAEHIAALDKIASDFQQRKRQK